MATQKRTVDVALSTTGVDAEGRPQRVPLVTANDGSAVAVEAPPAIEPDSDLVGEADEGETPMMGIEIDSDQLKRQKMLQEVSDLVKSNPQSAVGVFNRWLAPEQ